MVLKHEILFFKIPWDKNEREPYFCWRIKAFSRFLYFYGNIIEHRQVLISTFLSEGKNRDIIKIVEDLALRYTGRIQGVFKIMLAYLSLYILMQIQTWDIGTLKLTNICLKDQAL